MKSKKYKVYLSKKQRRELEEITKRGKHSATTIKRANILLNLDENNGVVQKQEDIAKQLCTTTVTIYNVSRKFVEEGLNATVYRKVRETPPIPPKATGDVEARIIALACSEAFKVIHRYFHSINLIYFVTHNITPPRIHYICHKYNHNRPNRLLYL